MPRASTQQYTFNSGELSPLLFGRQDLDQYQSGMSLCYNGVPLVQGGWTRRPGTVFATYARTDSFGGLVGTRLFEFRFSADLSFIIAATYDPFAASGSLIIRFFTLDGIVTESDVDVQGVSQANPAVVTANGHGYSDGDRVILSNMSDMQSMELREVIVANSTANTFEAKDVHDSNIDSTGFTAFPAGHTGTVAKIFEVSQVSGVTSDTLANIATVQSGDVLLLLTPDAPVMQLTRITSLNWEIETLDFFVGATTSLNEKGLSDGPYLAINDTSTTLTPSGTTGSITLTASSTTGVNDGDGFQTGGDLGRLIRLNDAAGDWTWGIITTVNSTTNVDFTLLGPDLSSTAATDAWRLGLYCGRNGYPTTGGFHENRLWLGGVDAFPERIDASKSGDFFNFEPTQADGTVADDNAISVFVTSGDVNRIEWMETDSKGLLLGTTGGEWLLSAASSNEPMTPTSTTARRVSGNGSQLNTRALRIGNAVIFVQRGGRQLRELAFVFEIDGFKAPDLSVLSEHLTRPELGGELARQLRPQPLLWMNRSDGALLGLTYDRDQGAIGWHWHELGGFGTAAGGVPEVESVALLPGASGDSDELWMVVKRYVNGQEERHIEFMSKIWEIRDTQAGAFYVDSGITRLSPGTDQIGGLWMHEGETLKVWAEGSSRPDVTVSDGYVTLDDDSYSVVTLGLGYDSDAELMPVEAGSAEGSSQTKQKTIHKVGFWLMDTLELRFGPDSGNLHEVKFQFYGDDYGVAPDLFTGVVRETFEGDVDLLGQVYWRCETPAPCTVLSMTKQLTTQDDT